MKIKKIILENIRSYQYQEIEFTEGSTLLAGDIGSGKTSILLAIEFALFGLQPGQRGSALLRNGETEGKVKINFEVDENEVIVERTLKKSKTISQDYCAITINNEKKELSVTELKSKILEILNYPSEFSKKQNILYKFTVYTPQEEMKQIILEDSDTRINTLRHVFGINKYKKILENLSILTSKLREEKRLKEGMTASLEEIKFNFISKESELQEKISNLSSVEGDLFSRKKFREEAQKEKDEISNKIEERNKLLQEIEKTKIMIANKQETTSSNNKTIAIIKDQIFELQRLSFDEYRVEELEKSILLNKKEKENLTHKNIEINSTINSIELKINESKKLETNFSDLKICPTCLQNVDAVYRANVLNKLHSENAEARNKIDELVNEKNELNLKSKKVDENISLAEKQLTELKIMKVKLQGINEKQTQIQTIENSNLVLEKDMHLLRQHLQSLIESSDALVKFVNLFNEKQSVLDNALRQERIAEIRFAELKKEIEVFSKQIEVSKIEIEKMERIKEKLNYISDLENWLSKTFNSLMSFVEKNVMIRLKSEFSKFFAEWFYMLVSDNFNVRLSDDFTPIIEQQDYEIDYAYLSGGERTAIALAYRLALNQVINSLLSKIKTRDLVILDEPTDGFSGQQLDKMRDILQQLDIKQLIIVSHEQKIEGFVENVIKLKKQSGTSNLEDVKTS